MFNKTKTIPLNQSPATVADFFFKYLSHISLRYDTIALCFIEQQYVECSISNNPSSKV